MNLNDFAFDLKAYGCPGLISGLFSEAHLVDFFERLLPKTRARKISHGEAILAFVLNGISFARRQLYLCPEFFRGLSVSRLFGREMTPEDLNESVMGEALN